MGQQLPPLPQAERQALDAAIRLVKTPYPVRRSALVLLALSEPSATVRKVAQRHRLSNRTVGRIREYYETNGLTGVLKWVPKNGKPGVAPEICDRLLKITADHPTLPIAEMARLAEISTGAAFKILRANGRQPQRRRRKRNKSNTKTA